MTDRRSFSRRIAGAGIALFAGAQESMAQSHTEPAGKTLRMKITGRGADHDRIGRVPQDHNRCRHHRLRGRHTAFSCLRRQEHAGIRPVVETLSRRFLELIDVKQLHGRRAGRVLAGPSAFHGINRPKQGFCMNTAAQFSPSSASLAREGAARADQNRELVCTI